MENLDPDVEKELYRIRHKDMSELTEYDKGFLRARATYLGRKDRKKYKDILQQENKPIEKPQEDVNPNPFPPETEDDGVDE